MMAKPVSKPKRTRRRPPRASGVGSVNLLRRIARGVSILRGEGYFPSLVRQLTETLGMDYAFIGEFARDNREVVNVISAHFAGRTIDSFGFQTLSTPCHEVAHGKPCVYPRGVRKSFPDDRSLVDLQVECYAGIPLFGSYG